MQAPLEPAAEQIPQRAAAADAVQQVRGRADTVGAQVDGHRRGGVVRAVGLPAGTQHRGGGGVLQRGRVDESLRLTRAELVGHQLLDPAEATDPQRAPAGPALGVERSRGQPW